MQLVLPLCVSKHRGSRTYIDSTTHEFPVGSKRQYSLFTQTVYLSGEWRATPTFKRLFHVALPSYITVGVCLGDSWGETTKKWENVGDPCFGKHTHQSAYAAMILSSLPRNRKCCLLIMSDRTKLQMSHK